MLDTFRKHSRSWGIYLTFGAIILIFAVGFGAVSPEKACGGPSGAKGAKYAQIAGERVDASLFDLAVEMSADFPNPKDTGRALFTEPFKTTRFPGLNLKGPFSACGLQESVDAWRMSMMDPDSPEALRCQSFGRAGADTSPVKIVKVMDDVIEMKLVANYAKGLGMAVSNEEMNERLATFLKSFADEKTGKFQPAAFQSWLGRMGASSATFENFVKDELLREKVIQLLVGEVAPADSEIDAQHTLENETVKLEVVSFDKGSARPLVLVTAQEVSDWLAKNEDKVKELYGKRKDIEFTTPKKLKLRGIKLTAPDPKEAADDAQRQSYTTERAAVKTKAQDLLKQLQGKLAASPTPAPKPDAPAPTPTPDTPPAPAPTAVDPAAVFAEFAKSSSEDDASKEAGGLLGDGIPLPELGRRPYNDAVKTALEAAKPLVPTDVVEADDAFWIFMVESATEQVVTSYDDAKSKLAKRLLQEERVDSFKQKLADEFFAAAKADPKKKLADIAKDLNTKYQAEDGKGLVARETPPLPRMQHGSSPFVPGAGDKAPSLMRAAFAATADSPLLPQVFPITSRDSFVVARLLEKTPAKPLEAAERDALKRTLALARKRAIYRGWYEDLLAKAMASGDVKIEDGFTEEKKRAEDAYVQAGGLLPGMKAPANPQGLTINAGGGPGGSRTLSIPVQPPK